MALRVPARWHIEVDAPGLLFERVVAKDNYESPAWLWRHYVEHESFTVDVDSSALNAVMPTYLTTADPPAMLERLRGVGIWLNPAYGPKCSAIEPTLERLLSTAVTERDCWLVAFLPVYSFRTWCAAPPRPHGYTTQLPHLLLGPPSPHVCMWRCATVVSQV